MSITGAQIAAPTPFPTLDLDFIDKQERIAELKARLAFERGQAAAAKALASSGVVAFLISPEEMANAGLPKASDLVCSACISGSQKGWCLASQKDFPCPR